MEKEQNKKIIQTWIKSKGLVGEALLIAGFTAITYLSSYVFQITYLFYFKVPLLFVDVKTSNVLSVGLIVLFWVITNVFILGLIIGSKYSLSRKIFVSGLVFGVQFGAPIPVIFMDVTHPWRSAILVISLAVIGIFTVVDLYRNNKNKNEDGIDVILDKVEESFGTVYVILIFMSIFIITYAGIFGFISAKLKSEFLVISTQPDVAVIFTHGEDFVGLTFSTSTKKISTEVRVITNNQITTNTVFKMEKLEPTFLYYRE